MFDEIIALRITSVSGGEVHHSSRGTTIVFKPGRGGTTTTTSGLTFKGEYVEANRSACKKDEIYVVFDGTNQGTYICLKDSPTNHPWEGTDWISLPMGSSVGAWT